MKATTRRRGFTLLEIVITITMIAMLSVVAMSIFFNMQDPAIESAEKAVASAIRSGIANHAAESVTLSRDPLYPDVLDTATNDAASPTNPLFTGIIEVPIRADWTKISDIQYIGPAETSYVYDKDLGTFKIGQPPVSSVASYDFEDGALEWTEHGSHINVVDGEYVMGNGNRIRQQSTFAGEDGWTDYTVRLTANMEQGNGFGVFFRTTNADNGTEGYIFQVDPGYGRGAFLMRRWTNNREESPFARVWADPDFQWYGVDRDIQVEVSGNTFNAYVDGVRVLTGNDSTYASGGIGMRTWSDTLVSFDDISVE
jgi:prepilin-type N-terminal cleavage/methylation domain-containing protein